MLAYFDCFSGISGDMVLGALLHLGVPRDWLQEQLGELKLEGFRLEVEQVHRSGIGALHVDVVCEAERKERSFGEIKRLIEAADLSRRSKGDSLLIFKRLAEAEAAIHGCEVEAVHFHEVGAVDAIVDIVGAVLGLDYLGVTEVHASRLPLGTGFVDCRHGRIPVPAPATVALLKNVPVVGTDIQAELVTPTGAAILTELARSFGAYPPMRIDRSGYGAGLRELNPGPNLLRIVLGGHDKAGRDTPEGYQQDRVWVLETAIDDMTPEVLSYCVERLMGDGALDVLQFPVYMKKNRSGTVLQVICRPEQKEALLQRLLAESSTLGVRHYRTDRRKLARESATISTSFGEIAVKRILLPQGGVRFAPEFEVCRRIALEYDLPLQQVYDRIAAEAPGGADALDKPDANS